MRRVVTGAILLLCFCAAHAQSLISFPTPRMAAEHFMRAAAEDRWDDAAQALDLDEITSENKAEAARAAAKDIDYLLDVIEFDPATISDELQDDVVLNRIADASGNPVGEIVIGRRQGGYAFASSTVVKAAAMAAAVRRAQQSAESGKQTESSAPEELHSPRATLTTFMSAMNAGRVSVAITTLDLSRIDQFARTDRGTQWSNRLLAILNRTQYFAPGTIPEHPDGDSYTVASYKTAAGIQVGSIVLTKSADGAWRFSPDSLASLDRIWNEVQHRPVLAGLRDVDEVYQDPSSAVREASPPEWFRPAFAGLAWWQVIWFGIFLGIALILGLIARLIVAGVLRLKLRFAMDAVPDDYIRRVGLSLNIFVAALVLRRGIRALGFEGLLSSSLLIITEVIAAIGAVGVLWGVWDSAVILIGRRLSGRNKRVNTLFMPVLRQFGLLVIAASILLYSFSRLGVNVTGLITGLGIGGAILALAAKDSVENLFGSVTILFEVPFGIGDWVKVGDVEGTVEEISLRSTRIRTFADSIVVLPNRTLTTSPVENFGRRRYRRFKTTLGLSPLTPAERVKEFSEAIRTHLAERPDIWQEKKRVWFNDFDNVSLRILIDTYIIAPDLEHELAARDEILRFILNTADSLGVNFSFPASPVGVERTPETTPKDI